MYDTSQLLQLVGYVLSQNPFGCVQHQQQWNPETLACISLLRLRPGPHACKSNRQCSLKIRMHSYLMKHAAHRRCPDYTHYEKQLAFTKAHKSVSLSGRHMNLTWIFATLISKWWLHAHILSYHLLNLHARIPPKSSVQMTFNACCLDGPGTSYTRSSPERSKSCMMRLNQW